MAVNPISVIVRQDFNTYDYGIDKGNIGLLNKFPSSLGNDNNMNEPAMLFKFHSAIAGKGEPEDSRLTGANRYIGLPVSPDLKFQDKYTFEEKTVNSIGTAVANTAERTLQNIYNLFTSGMDIGLRRSGQAPNEMMAVAFKNPEFRTYQFSWELFATSQEESVRLMNIIHLFRIAAAAKFEGGETAAYIKYPDLVSFVVVTKQGNIFPASYACFIESVDYEPAKVDGQVPFFQDGFPIGWKFSISLKESMYLDKEDINGSNKQGF